LLTEIVFSQHLNVRHLKPSCGKKPERQFSEASISRTPSLAFALIVIAFGGTRGTILVFDMR